MKCEIVAVGTELLLGQVTDTNSAWIGEQLALEGIDIHHQCKVGDNLERICEALQTALGRSDAVVVCGGLGPTPDDITREALAAVMGVPLRRREDQVERIRKVFAGRRRGMPENNLRQADAPEGAEVIPILPGTAPGLACPVDGKVVYAVPGVPWEMKAMFSGWIVDDLRRRFPRSGVIVSRTLRTWGESESGLAEKLDGVLRRLDESRSATLAFLASGVEGLKVRLTTKAETEEEAADVLDAEEAAVRAAVGEHLVFGVGEETMESVVLDLCRRSGYALAAAESVTGGMIASRLVGVPGASEVFRGSVVAYEGEVKRELLGVPEGPVVSEAAVRAMAEGVCRLLRADCSVAVSGVAGPASSEGEKPGTVWMATAVEGGTQARKVVFPFDRERTRQFATITSLNFLRLRLLHLDGDPVPWQ